MTEDKASTYELGPRGDTNVQSITDKVLNSDRNYCLLIVVLLLLLSLRNDCRNVDVSYGNLGLQQSLRVKQLDMII